MITAQLQHQWAERLLAQAPPAPAPWVEELRRQAGRRLPDLPLVNRKQEAWRYTNVEPILKTEFDPVVNRPAEYTGPLPEPLFPHVAVLVDGWLMPGLSRLDDLPEGVTLMSLADALAADDPRVRDHLDRLAGSGDQLFDVLNTALLNDGLFLHLAPGVVLDAPIEVFHLNSDTGRPTLAQPRHLMVLEAGAAAVVVEHHLAGAGSEYLHNGLSEIILEDGARLAHTRIQDESPAAWHLSTLLLDQEADSRYHGITLAFGSRLSRTFYRDFFGAEGAHCTLRGLYTVGDDQLQDFHLDVRHNVPHCSSREQFKGLLYGKGRAVFDGRILVEHQAQKSDAELTNDNLMLTRNAEVDTKPQLEIYADDVKASHGTTVGQLEPQQIFYLRARGIPQRRAQHLLCEGFAGEIIDHVQPEPLREQAMARLRSTLDQLDAHE